MEEPRSIHEIMAWWRKYSSTSSPEMVLQYGNWLSSFAYFEAETLYLRRKEYAQAEVTRKHLIAKSVIDFRKEGQAIKEAESNALIKYIVEYEAEKLLEAEVMGLKGVMDSVYRTMDFMRSTVSLSKSEKEYTRDSV